MRKIVVIEFVSLEGVTEDPARLPAALAHMAWRHPPVNQDRAGSERSVRVEVLITVLITVQFRPAALA